MSRRPELEAPPGVPPDREDYVRRSGLKRPELAMDLADYFMRIEREFEVNSAYPDRPVRFDEEEGSNGARGRILAFLGLTDDAYMKVIEFLEVQPEGRVIRSAYSYALIIDGAFAYGWERDPNTHPEQPVHEHGPEPARERQASEPVTLSEALRQAWKLISLQAEAPP